MSIINLTDEAAGTDGSASRDEVQFRVALTLTELKFLADQVGLRLPFGAEARPVSAMEARLSRLGGRGTGGANGDDAADVMAALPDARTSLSTRGLITDTSNEPDGGDGTDTSVVLAPALVQILALLALPEIAVDMDVTYDQDGAPVRLRVYHHAAGDQVATLASANGIVWETALIESADWSRELARVATPPGGDPAASDDVAAGVSLPFPLLTVGCELIETGRRDLLPSLLDTHDGQVRRDGRDLTVEETTQVLDAVAASHGRLRALITRPAQPEPETTETKGGSDAGPQPRATEPNSPRAGVVSWVLLANGWRALRPRGNNKDPRVLITAETPESLTTDISRVVAEVLP
ncbi:hypothetical protein [Nocardioides aurantiacus]|uniref:ESAT-6 protein secretion system EspG family protein n=1 Tax=Nocardioides aurantiacus TaxID=86796 RepID=A0A3N2CTV8_9ACTN|nr:hypothetical protein [Nocardioides aurantiacus]ROR90970.1 hypothetical protein EDD33_1827 [Nocardioides aurantiacus]